MRKGLFFVRGSLPSLHVGLDEDPHSPAEESSFGSGVVEQEIRKANATCHRQWNLDRICNGQRTPCGKPSVVVVVAGLVGIANDLDLHIATKHFLYAVCDPQMVFGKL